MKWIIAIIAIFAITATQAQIAYVTDLDPTAEWITYEKGQIHKPITGIGIAEVRYQQPDGWIIEQSNNLVDWFPVLPLYAEVDGAWLVGLFPLVNDGDTRVFFRLTDEFKGKKIK